MVGDVRELGVEGVLDAVEFWHATRVEADAQIFVAAAHFADLHHPGSRPECGRVLPGSERGVRLGGVGTPVVLEFAPAEFAARVGKSPYAGRALIADALDTRHRLPRLWARVVAGEVPVFYARHVAQQTRELSVAGAGLVDTGVVQYADGRIGWSRFENLVAAKIIEADPQAAAERERAAAAEEFVRVGRSTEHGQKTLYVRSAAAEITFVFATIDFFALVLAALGDTDSLDKRQVKAPAIMANPPQAVQLLLAFAAHRTGTTTQPDHTQPDAAQTGAAQPAPESQPGDAPDTPDHLDGSVGNAQADEDEREEWGCEGVTTPRRFRPDQIRPDSRFALGFDPRKVMPQVVLYLHLYARTDTGQVGPVARWEGEGPVSTAYVRDVLGPACEFVVRPVLDPANLAPVDAYEVPDRHREAVHLRTPADVFPYAANTTRSMQLDHTKPYLTPDHGGPPGQTAVGNLGPMTRFHHRIKTHGSCQLKQPFPGIYLWRDPHGRIYLVDHTGTRPLGTTGSGATMPDLAAEIAPPPQPGRELTYDITHIA